MGSPLLGEVMAKIGFGDRKLTGYLHCFVERPKSRQTKDSRERTVVSPLIYWDCHDLQRVSRLG